MLVLIAAAALAASSLTRPATAADPLDKVEAGVLEDMAQGKGVATFWALMSEKANLTPAYGIHDSDDRGEFVYNELTSTAERTQADLRSFLTRRGADFEPFWIANAIKITGDEALLREVAARPDVARVLKDRTYEVPKPAPGEELPKVDVVEWNIDRVRADEVWSTFGVRGEGIVVANIDTGFQFNHPALVQQYRGNEGGGNFDHNYNWFDPSSVCGSPSLVPCDNHGHGTHTMGTMVGDDGDPGPNQIGVAPHARFIGAKGCETNSCSSSALLASAQWILAPTDLNGQNPRPDLRPHAVNNSWGGGGGDPWYQASVDAWIASGIFPSFSNGNGGFGGCNTSGSPGDYVQSYSAGAFDINNNIAGFSSRGPSAFGGGELKPNVAAPGVNVRSSIPGGYASFNGTSMAAPHVTATVALMWSAAVAIERDIAATRTLLDDTAVDTFDPQCGGTADDNNVWGEGKLDAFAAVDQAPRGPTGTLSGTVTDTGNGNPIAGAEISAVGPSNRTTTTDASGNYSMTLPVGDYDVTASKFGYASMTQPATITDGGTTDLDFALTPAPSHPVSGTVTDQANQPIENATVTILGTPIPPATTDANGDYSFASVPEGTYDVRAEAGRCNDPQTQQLVVDGPETLDFTLPGRSDDFGYMCRLEAASYIEGDTPFPLSGDDSFAPVTLPFAFPYYGQTYSNGNVCTNGFLTFGAGTCPFSNGGIPSTFAPNTAIYAYWDDLFVGSGSSMWTRTLTDPSRFVIEWRNVHYFADSTRRVDFEIVLYENGQILTQYRNIDDDGRETGNSATLGIENEDGSIAFQYSFNESVLNVGETAIRYFLPPSGFVEGTVTDFNDNAAVAGASVKAIQGGAVVRQTTTDAAGFYRMQLALGDYTIEASKTNYETVSADVSIDEEDETIVQNFTLRTARAEVDPTELDFAVPYGGTASATLTLSNTGSLDMTWDVQESGGGAASAAGIAGLEKDPGYNPNAATTEGLYKVERSSTNASPDAPGDIIRQWTPTGLELAWGVGYTGNVWLSDVPTNNRNHEFAVTGPPSLRSHHAPWAGAWPGDMSPSSDAGEMCQVNVGGDNGIYCWNMDTGAVTRSITGAFPWTGISQRGLAYRPDDDSYYIGGWNEGIVYHVAGFSHPTPGAVISQCNPADPDISGLTWNPAVGQLWMATNSPTDTIYRIDPTTCATVSALAHPSHDQFDGAGLEMDQEGNLWMIRQSPNEALLVDSGVPAFSDVPWLSEDPTSGTIAPGASQEITVTVDTTGLAPGDYEATLTFRTNSGRQPNISVPVRLTVALSQNSGGGDYLDSIGYPWIADQAWSPGGFGYTGGRDFSTRRNISGTPDPTLYQDGRVEQHDYKFDALPSGQYEVTLKFAEIQNQRPGRRVFDVSIEGAPTLIGFDIASAAGGTFRAVDRTFSVAVTDGQLNVGFLTRRGFGSPLVNAIKVVRTG